MIFLYFCNTIGATSGGGTAIISGAPKFIPKFCFSKNRYDRKRYNMVLINEKIRKI
jgi:hypothetical protein